MCPRIASRLSGWCRPVPSEPMPDKLAPMQAELADAPFNARAGCGSPSSTAIACSRSSTRRTVRLRSRRGLELAARFPKAVPPNSRKQAVET